MEIQVQNLINRYKELADAGDTNAMVEYAKLIRKENPVEALKYYKMSADAGNVGTMVEYAKLVINKNPAESAKYLKKAADNGNAQGMLFYANLLRGSIGVEQDLNEAIRYYKMSADAGNTGGMFEYARLTYNKDPKEALEYYKKASEAGNTSAMFNYAKILWKGRFGIKPDKKEAVKYYKKLVDSSNVCTEIKYRCARLLYEGYGGEEGKSQALDYFKLAASEGDIRSLYFCVLITKEPENVAKDLYEVYKRKIEEETEEKGKEEKKKTFVENLKELMMLKDITKRKNIDFTTPINDDGDNLIDFIIVNNLVSYGDSAIINNLKVEELGKIKEENRKKLVECLVEVGNNGYLKKFLNEDFLKFDNEEEKYEFIINTLGKAFDNYNYDMVDILIGFIGGIDKIKDKDIPKFLNTTREGAMFNSHLFNLLLSRIEGEDKNKYLESIDNIYKEGGNGFGQIKRMREFDKSSNPIVVIDSGYPYFKGANDGEFIVGSNKLYETRYEIGGARETIFFDVYGEPLVKMISDDENQINTFNFKGTKYENIENIRDEEEKRRVLQEFRDKVDCVIGIDFVNCRGFDGILTNLTLAPIVLEDKIYEKPNPTIFQNFDDREKIAKTIAESVRCPEKEYVLGISNDNHHVVVVLSNGRAVLVNTSGNYEYYIEDIENMVRKEYEKLSGINDEKELKKKIKIKEVNYTGQDTGNCTLVGNVKTAKLLAEFDGDYQRFIDFGIKITKLGKDGKELPDVINVDKEEEIKEIREAIEKFSKVTKDLTSEKHENLLLINNSERLDKALIKITGVRELNV